MGADREANKLSIFSHRRRPSFSVLRVRAELTDLPEGSDSPKGSRDSDSHIDLKSPSLSLNLHFLSSLWCYSVRNTGVHRNISACSPPAL